MEVDDCHPVNSQDGDDLDEVQRDSVQLSDEHRSYALEAGGSVHVDSRSDGQNESADVLGHTIVLLHTFHHKGQRGRTDEKNLMIISSFIAKLFWFPNKQFHFILM